MKFIIENKRRQLLNLFLPLFPTELWTVGWTYTRQCLKKLVAKPIKTVTKKRRKEKNDRRKRKKKTIERRHLKWMDFRNEESAVQLTEGSSGITKLHFSKYSDLFAIFPFFVEKEERVKRANVPCRKCVSCHCKIHTHIQRMSNVVAVSSSNHLICLDDSQHATRSFARVWEVRVDTLYVYTYIHKSYQPPLCRTRRLLQSKYQSD